MGPVGDLEEGRLSRSTAASGGQAASSVKPLPTGHAPDWPVPSSSLHDCLGRVRRVKAKPLRGRFASLDTAATAKGGQLRGVRGRCRARRAALTAPGGRRSVHDRRAIGVPLARVTRGQPRPLADTYTRRSAPLAAVIAALPKLIVRVRFSSPAPLLKPQLSGMNRNLSSPDDGPPWAAYKGFAAIRRTGDCSPST
jgi:hypothetical protein